MKISLKLPVFSQSLLIFFIGAFGLLIFSHFGSVDAQTPADQVAVLAIVDQGVQRPATIENDCVLPICRAVSQSANPIEEIAKTLLETNSGEEFSCKSAKPVTIIKKINVVATAYSSTPWQTDDTPYITADGARVRDGIIANNMLAFGTQVRIPQLYGDKVFTVEDRMHWRKSNYQIDIWFPTLQQAVNFGAKSTYIEVLN